MTEIILASGSPRRRELLEQIGLSFRVVPALGDECISKSVPSEVVAELALQKASEVALGAPVDSVVIGADTIVTFDGVILGKPKDSRDAVRMLQMLQGRTHTVYTGVSVIWKGCDGERVDGFVEATDVSCFPMSVNEIEDYVRTGDPLDKAGAYGIQGYFARYIKRIDGDYYNVVGLPVGHLYQILRTSVFPG
ncbi:MAG: Maf family protein [Lachnospiraceae bacterium]|nr:Maf family protein [Lachnospiraceae bacterium]MDD3615724.1 Maf family protein [Lachnospiraceae bacterium]